MWNEKTPRLPARIAAVLGTLAVAAFAAAQTQTANTVRGTVVDVGPQARTLTFRVPLTEGGTLERTFHADELTRIRQDSGVVPFDRIGVGDAATITYARVDGRYVARVIELARADLDVGFPEDEPIETLEERQRYEEDVASTLDVLEEEIDELVRDPSISGVDRLARARELGSELRDQLSAARRRFDSLRAAGSDLAWQEARRELRSDMNALRSGIADARTELTPR